MAKKRIGILHESELVHCCSFPSVPLLLTWFISTSFRTQTCSYSAWPQDGSIGRRVTCVPQFSVDDLNPCRQSSQLVMIWDWFSPDHGLETRPGSFSISTTNAPPPPSIRPVMFLHCCSVPRLFCNVFLNVFLPIGPTPAPSRAFSFHFLGAAELECNK